MYYKCEMLVGGYAYDVTDNIQNWDDITASFKRSDYDGIVRSFSDKFEFVKGARSLLLDEYRTKYLKANASIVISTRNNSWTWTERFRCALNFSTLSDNGFTVSINAVDDSVASIIKAKKGTQYEYSVESLKDSSQLVYDRMVMTNFSRYDVVPNVENGTETVFDYANVDWGATSIPLYIESSEIVRKNDVEIVDQQEDKKNSIEDIESYFFKNLSKNTMSVRFTAELEVLYVSRASDSSATVVLFGKRVNGNTISIRQIFRYSEFINTFTTLVSIDTEFDVLPGEIMILAVVGKRCDVTIKKVNGMPKITWYSKGDNVSLDLIRPASLLNSLLKSMNGGEGLTGVIIPSGEKRLDNAMLLAAESARKIPDAKIYSSFTKFSDWMKAVFGYVYDINGSTITFRPRKDYFGDNVVKEIKDLNEYSMTVNSSLVYSQFSIGYDKQDYDSVNGKDEFRFTNQYSTGITMTENKLDIISPYRADAYGIEFLAQKIGEDTTDNSSDTDVFFVCVNEDTGDYVLNRGDVIEGVLSPDTMFNVMYSPTSMIDANKEFLAGYISDLEFASSDGNSSVMINGKPENRDISLEGGLFSVNEIEVETSDIDLPSDMTGIVQFEHQGKFVQGYYKNSDFRYTKTKSAKITLIEKK